MAWRQLSVDVPGAIKDLVIGELAECSASGFWERGEPGPDISRLEAYFDFSTNLEVVVSRLKKIFDESGLESPHVEVGELPDFDWLAEWKKLWVSFPLGSKFFVIPSWSEDSCPSDRIPVHMDPGQAFGTGTHETTQLTLEALEDLATGINPQLQVLDLGTGSGVLAIAARHLGFLRVTGCDIDPESIRVAGENILRNPARGAGIPLFCGSVDCVSSAAVELLLCNLTADVITDLFEDIVRVVRPGGIAILSGVLADQRVQVRDLFERAGWRVENDSGRGEWIALVIRKPKI